MYLKGTVSHKQISLTPKPLQNEAKHSNLYYAIQATQKAIS